MATLGAPVFGVVFEVTSVGRARTFPALCAFRVLRRRSHPGDPQHGLSVARIATAEPAFRLVHHRVGLAHLHFSRRIQSGFDVGRLDQQSFAGSTPNWPMDRRHRCGGHPRPHRVFWPCLARFSYQSGFCAGNRESCETPLPIPRVPLPNGRTIFFPVLPGYPAGNLL